jgi:hypothetical protein
VWGIFAAIDAVLNSLSHADPALYNPRQIPMASAGELLATLEE